MTTRPASRLTDLPQVQALSAQEKLQLVDELWQEVARDLESLDVSAAEKEVLDVTATNHALVFARS